MTAEQTNRPKSILSCVLCSIAWVLVTCWLGIINFIFLLFAAMAEALVMFFTIWGIGCIIQYWLLLWWTGRAYPSWKSWRSGLILQFCLVAISMFIAYFIGEGALWLTRPIGLLTLMVFDDYNNWASFIPNYLIAFVEIAAWQALAICLRRFFDKRKAKKLKYAPIEPPAPLMRKDEW